MNKLQVGYPAAPAAAEPNTFFKRALDRAALGNSQIEELNSRLRGLRQRLLGAWPEPEQKEFGEPHGYPPFSALDILFDRRDAALAETQEHLEVLQEII